MIFVRRRLVFWLFKAYIRRWGMRILMFFAIGLALFFLLFKLGSYFLPKIPAWKKESIGVVGAYSIDSLPMSITSQVSEGLTTIKDDGTIAKGLASSWNVENNGKKYVFHLQKNLQFSDNTKVTTSEIEQSFENVLIEKPDAYTIVYTLKDEYTPFLVTMSRPIFKSGFIGVGSYIFRDVKLNGNFIESLTLASVKDQYDVKIYHFYSNDDALKMAFVLGEITSAQNLSNIDFRNTTFASFPNTKINKKTNYRRLVTIFYNTKDPNMSDEKLRSALTYALPDVFVQGERNYTPYPPMLWANDPLIAIRKQDLDHANLLMTSSQTAKNSTLSLVIKTFARYNDTAKIVADSWKKIGVKTKIEVVDTVPSTFQIFLGDFVVPRDPDQYTIWHSGQNNNITQYDNKRIDKLLEDGRKTVELEKRIKIYSDFQKYILADSPASFLYFPYEYELLRK